MTRPSRTLMLIEKLAPAWVATLGPAKVVRLGPPVAKRYPRLPEDYAEFLSRVRNCDAADERAA